MSRLALKLTARRPNTFISVIAFPVPTGRPRKKTDLRQCARNVIPLQIRIFRTDQSRDKLSGEVLVEGRAEELAEGFGGNVIPTCLRTIVNTTERRRPCSRQKRPRLLSRNTELCLKVIYNKAVRQWHFDVTEIRIVLLLRGNISITPLLTLMPHLVTQWIVFFGRGAS